MEFMELMSEEVIGVNRRCGSLCKVQSECKCASKVTASWWMLIWQLIRQLICMSITAIVLSWVDICRQQSERDQNI